MYGPGHQSQEDGFKYYSDDVYERDMDVIKECFNDYISNKFHYTNCSVLMWEVEKLPESYARKEINSINRQIESLKAYQTKIVLGDMFIPKKKMKSDEDLIKSLKGKVVHKLLSKLHKAGFTYTLSDISKWKDGTNGPAEFIRSKVLEIIEKSESYPSNV